MTNINDNDPYFLTSTYTVSIHEFTEIGSQLVQVLANDADDYKSVRMNIASGNTNAVFNMAQTTGVITLAKSPYLFSQNVYTLMIRLVDTGGLQDSMQATVTINIIRMTAVRTGCQAFGSNTFRVVSISESAPIGTLVVDLNGTPVAPGRNIM